MAHKILSLLFTLLITLTFQGNSSSYVAIEGELGLSTENSTKNTFKNQLNKFKFQNNGPFIAVSIESRQRNLKRPIVLISLMSERISTDLIPQSALAVTVFKTGPPPTLSFS
jgi:hypothetical protein